PRGGLVEAGEATLDPRAVVLDVEVGLATERLARRDDRVVGLTHGVGREVRVGARTVPVAGDRLGVEGGGDVELLAAAVQQPAGDPDLVGHVDRPEGADLELPLPHHHLGVGPRDGDAGVHARLGVHLDDLTAPDLVGAHTAVVRTLRAGEAALGPAERPAVLQERVLLLDAEPRLLFGVLLRDLDTRRTGVGGVRGHVGQQDLAHHEDVVAAADRIGEDGDRAEHAVGLAARRLVGARPVEAPDRGLDAVGDDLR